VAKAAYSVVGAMLVDPFLNNIFQGEALKSGGLVHFACLVLERYFAALIVYNVHEEGAWQEEEEEEEREAGLSPAMTTPLGFSTAGMASSPSSPSFFSVSFSLSALLGFTASPSLSKFLLTVSLLSQTRAMVGSVTTTYNQSRRVEGLASPIKLK